jgi:hypothetical protein
MSSENEDLDYTFRSDVLTPTDPNKDPDAKNISVLDDVLKYLNSLIRQHNTFDVIDNSKNAPLTIKQQVEVHKLLVSKLRPLAEYIEGKIKELNP